MKTKLAGLLLIAMSFYWLGRYVIPAAPLHPNEQVSAKVATLNKVLQDQADNDPRVDSELSNLNQKERLDFRAKYRSLPPEALKNRGLIVYLIGRNIETQGDLEFMREVLNERNCLSLKNCTITDQKTLSEPTIAANLAFPKLMAVAALKEKLHTQPSAKMREAIEDILHSARDSMNPLVVKAAG